METTRSLQNTRRYDIDWLRIGLIFSVFLFHIGMFFNGFGWHVKNNEEIAWLNPVMGYLHRWRMPLLFFVSGVGTYYALGKRTILQYVKERHNRLIIPLVFSMLVIVPPQVFVEKQAVYGSYFNFLPHLFEGAYPKGNMSWHHLWFVLYLFVCSVAGIPFILLMRSKFKDRIYRFLNRVFSYKGAFLLLALPLYLSGVLLRPYFPWETHALVNDIPYLVYNFLFFLYGYILFSNPQLIRQLVAQRRVYAVSALIMSIVFFVDLYHSMDPWVPESVQLLLGALFEWSMALAILGYAGKYLNRDHPWRKYLNEAIYPFYILHQTVIVVIGFFLVNAAMSNGMKALVLTMGSLTICITIYLALIRPFKVTRVLFGMRNRKTARPASGREEKKRLRAA